jgi:nicotinate phosphoribosyltransferase
MAASYQAHRFNADATFSLFVRNYPPKRNFLVVAGLEDVLGQLEMFQFAEDEIQYLKKSGLFPDVFLDHLQNIRFSGQVYAMPEGTIFFPGEPILEITAPLIEAQLLETFLLNTIGFSSMIASKAARCVIAADGRSLIGFSFRRTQGLDAGLHVARSMYMAGFSATSNVLAGKIYDIPISGTMAHSYVTAFSSEPEAFSAYAENFPDHAIFLIDTFDTLEGARNAVQVARQMRKKGHSLIGVRLDSGDMTALSKKVRKIFDDAGLGHVKVFASGGFDEYKIADALSDGAHIDAFGVGTKVGVSADAPYMDIVYKMVKFNDRNVRKLSPGKATLADQKQVFRKVNTKGQFQEDIIGLRDEAVPGTRPLLEKVMADGRCLRPHPPLPSIQNRFKRNLSLLEEKYKSLQTQAIYPVSLSKRLQKTQEKL